MADLPLDCASARVQGELGKLANLNSLLYGILLEIAAYALATWGWRVFVLSIFRDAAEEARIDTASKLGLGRKPGTRSPHAFWLALDIRTVGVDPEWVEALDAWINARWQYDPARPEMTVSDIKPHGTGIHLHLQAQRGMTRRRPETEGAG